eukprot:NODE_2082_length_999_cov_1.548729.p1 GENE.NODE_2082_length_999_cov_1.548729~~NODE_2082_length_999_cov_1.548729.p1  ORF type:complete len:145 (-),score=14.88 NODE_2082_length_999_cov_1.548729:17-451(-)
MGHTITHAATNRVSWSSVRAPQSLKLSPLYQSLTLQQKHGVAYSLCTDTTPALFRDVSSGACGWVRTSTFGADGQHLSFTGTPGQLTIVFKQGEEPRWLLGQEAMVLQGFPIAAVSDLVERTNNNSASKTSLAIWWPRRSCLHC